MDSWELLRSGVPLSLLCDLATPDGPDSMGILLAESGDPAESAETVDASYAVAG